jgi:L-threonylcarbamoyladenylate synthase
MKPAMGTTMIQTAVDILRRGGLVAFPTETVYGLGADATNPAAVARIFTAKGRPATNPLIVHVADEATARKHAAEWPDLAGQLAEQFWPGPLTIVVNRGLGIADAVTAGGPTVGLRVPDHPLALELLGTFGGAVAAPSANRSEHVSPTLASHVVDDLGDRVDLILDGGPCGVGIESTVVDVSQRTVRILRLGGVGVDELEQIVGPCQLGRGRGSNDFV